MVGSEVEGEREIQGKLWSEQYLETGSNASIQDSIHWKVFNIFYKKEKAKNKQQNIFHNSFCKQMKRGILPVKYFLFFFSTILDKNVIKWRSTKQIKIYNIKEDENKPN